MIWRRMACQELLGLRDGYALLEQVIDNPGCNNGHYPAWKLVDPVGNVVAHGKTCRCGRGCSNTDCVVDVWGYHDTVIEKYRAEGGVSDGMHGSN